ncbi:sulfurtransferase [Williamsoniiplasma luminosum]|uniref:Rhodanese-like domain-containing protein n=1 Tax=Williamsoniiplasma luminosum TaxID=214888 RepID=A0A2K8NSU0_9MOLU|nr:rhodanese-like domain-containing protein [Williamsoniiplasma luminosum]ATZ16837.1 sulfurtransferase [Williamsoniiplasma luminosum]AVP49509.1 MAG: rhodanese-like domain-containing protein [Williamsoniiplasma luminosum]
MKDYVTAREFYEKLEQGWKVIDVRSPQELKYLQKFPNSINIPYPEVVDRMTHYFPDKNVKLITLCNAGNRSGMTARAFRRRGYLNVYVLNGGIEGLDL